MFAAKLGRRSLRPFFKSILRVFQTFVGIVILDLYNNGWYKAKLFFVIARLDISLDVEIATHGVYITAYIPFLPTF